MIDTRTQSLPSHPDAVKHRARTRQRRRAALVVGLIVAVAAVGTAAASAAAILPSGTLLSTGPSSDDGYIPDDQPVDLDAAVPAIEKLDPDLRDALASAADAAAADGLSFDITSGWRSAAYQQRLLDDAVATYGEEAARQLVATPDMSSHVTGDAVDLGPVDLQFWLMQYGADFGLCQTYANERWHWELATTPGGMCPEMLEDASSPR